MQFEITPTSTATAVGLFMSASFFAIATSTSLSVIPTLMLPPPRNAVKPGAASNNVSHKPETMPSQLVRQWMAIYEDSKKAGPFTAGLSAVSWLYVASVLPINSRASNLYIIGAFLCIGVVPFTFTIMKRSVEALCERANMANAGKKLPEEKSIDTNELLTVDIIWKWSRLNLIRGLLPVLGMACVITANL